MESPDLNTAFPAEQAYQSKFGYFPRAVTSSRQEKLLKTVNSYLQLILEIPKLFDLPSRIVLCNHPAGDDNMSETDQACLQLLKESLVENQILFDEEMGDDQLYGIELGCSIQIRVPDKYGREWVGPFLALNEMRKRQGSRNNNQKVNKNYAIFTSPFWSIERLIALMLDRSQMCHFLYHQSRLLCLQLMKSPR